MLSGQHSPEPTNLFVLCHRVPGEMNWGNRKSTSIVYVVCATARSRASALTEYGPR